MKKLVESMQKKKQYSMDELAQKHDTIAALYDYAEDLVATVESDLIQDPEVQLAAVEPLINDIVDATDVLSEEFVLIAESKQKGGKSRASKKRIEAALRKLYMATHDYYDRVHNDGKKALGGIMNIADAIVKKIQRQVEEVVVIFLEFVHISLQSLMNKADLDELRLRDARVALMMHEQSLGQHS